MSNILRTITEAQNITGGHICLMNKAGDPLGVSFFAEDSEKITKIGEEYCELTIVVAGQTFCIPVLYMQIFTEDGYDLFVDEAVFPYKLRHLWELRHTEAYNAC